MNKFKSTGSGTWPPRVLPAMSLLIIMIGQIGACGAPPEPPDPLRSEPENGPGDERLLDPSRLSWSDRNGSRVSLIGPDGPIWTFRYNREKYGKPHFHPVSTVSGTPLTWLMPPDHVWHYGIWFSWKEINGINFWEENKQTHQAPGRTSWSSVSVRTTAAGAARISLDLRYHEPGADPLLTEQRTIHIRPPRKNGTYVMDWTCNFEVGDTNVKLDRTPLPGEEGGQPWGGYAGLSIRYAKRLTDRKLVTNRGPVSFQSTPYARPRAKAADLTGHIDEQTAGIAMLGHPSNPRYPVPWYAIRKGVFGFLNAALIQHEPMTLPAGETMTLRYRLIVHRGRWSKQRLKRAVRRYTNHDENQPSPSDR